MKSRKTLLIGILALLLLSAGTTLAGNTATQGVNWQVSDINELAASGNPGNLVVSSAIPGSQPSDALDSSTTYGVTTNGANKKVTGRIDSALPAGLTLKVYLAPPSGAASLGTVTLGVSASDLVTGITRKAERGMTITYTLSATVTAGIVPTGTRTVTLTLTDG